MRKPEKEIKDRAEIEEILGKAPVLRLGMSREDQPYLLPLNFVYLDRHIYIHTGRVGRKMDVLRANPRVCFEVAVDTEPIPGPHPCAWDYRYRSVIGFGRATEVTDPDERRRGLMALVERYAGPDPGALDEAHFARTLMLRIDIESMTGKHN